MFSLGAFYKGDAVKLADMPLFARSLKDSGDFKYNYKVIYVFLLPTDVHLVRYSVWKPDESSHSFYMLAIADPEDANFLRLFASNVQEGLNKVVDQLQEYARENKLSEGELSEAKAAYEDELSEAKAAYDLEVEPVQATKKCKICEPEPPPAPESEPEEGSETEPEPEPKPEPESELVLTRADLNAKLDSLTTFIAELAARAEQILYQTNNYCSIVRI
mmetsp:Transcript_42229/g.104066  ORF Transcript_42229/g.104066 Transcript_42229/m.104066 type:complete len:218 (+) Transcript_42229:343-996(+)